MVRVLRAFALGFAGFIFLMVSGFTQTAGAQQTKEQVIVINGQPVTVMNIQTREFNGHQILHTADLVAPTVLNFAHGNRMLVAGHLFFHNNGQVWMAEAVENAPAVSWRTPQGQNLLLLCAQPPTINGIVPPARILSFFDNGEYQRGCRIGRATMFTDTANQRVNVSPAATVDLNDDGTLAYASSITEGRLHFGDQTAQLAAGSEIDFFADGHPRFFQLAQGQSLIVPSGRLGDVRVEASVPASYIQFNQQGRIESAVLGSDIAIGSLTVPAGSYLSFEKLSDDASSTPGADTREVSVVLKAERQISVAGSSYWVSQIHWDSKNNVIGVIASRGFAFRPPEGAAIDVPAGSKIYFSENGTVVRIDVPNGDARS